MISKSECVVGVAYRLRSRNLSVGVWTGIGFVGPREKFGSLFPFVEYHYDDGPPFGTASPVAKLEECPISDLAEGHVEGKFFFYNAALLDWLLELEDREISR